MRHSLTPDGSRVVVVGHIGTDIIRAGDHDIATSFQQVNPNQLSNESEYYGKCFTASYCFY